MKNLIFAFLVLTSLSVSAKEKKKDPEFIQLQKDCQKVAKDLGCVRADGTVERSCERVIDLSDDCRKALGL